MAGIVLNVEQRARTGTGGARATRKAGLIPGVIYGGARGSIAIELKSTEVLTALRSGKFISHMIEIAHKGERQPVIPRAIQLHPVTDYPEHIDLYRVEPNAEIAIDVVVRFRNHDASPGLKRGGVLNIVRHTIRLKVPANKIPEEVIVDLTGTEIGDSVHISSVKLPEGARPTIRDRDFTIATVAGRKAEIEPETTTAAVAATPADGEARADAAAATPDKKPDKKSEKK